MLRVVARQPIHESYNNVLPVYIQDGYVAVKIHREASSSGSGRRASDADEYDVYTGTDGDGDKEEDWAVEERNNLHFTHPNIMPMLATVGHGNYNMTIYPLARTSLDRLMKKTCSVSLTDIVTNMANLFSALALMHAGVPDCYGYHFDIKYDLDTLGPGRRDRRC
jgi:hypothetical protein